jgi:chemotaxis protein CheC
MSAAVPLTDLQKEALKEVGNIGAGHAATALSQLLNAQVKLSEPTIDITTMRKAGERIWGSRALAATHMQVIGDLPGQMLVLFEHDSALQFVSSFVRRIMGGDAMIFESIVDSTLKEMGNILAGSYLTALIELTGVKTCFPSVPTLAYGTMDVALKMLVDVADDQELMLIDSSFLNDVQAVSGQVVLVPSEGGLKPLFDAFGLS